MIAGTLTLIILLFSFSGSSFDVIKEAAEDVIQDKQVFSQIKAVTHAADDEVEAWLDNAHQLSEQFIDMNREYDLTPDEMRSFLDFADARREAFQEKLIQLRFRAKDLMTQREWEAMYVKIQDDK